MGIYTPLRSVSETAFSHAGLIMQVCFVTYQGNFRQKNEDALRMGSFFISDGASMDTPVCLPLVYSAEIPTAEVAATPGQSLPEITDRIVIRPGDWVAVADGMGGHGGGDIASSAVIRGLGTLKIRPKSEEDIRDIPRLLVEDLRNCIREGYPSHMGTTLSGLCFTGDSVILLHVGDSRIYTRSPFALLTRDDTHVQELIDEELATEKERNFHPAKNLLTKALIADRDPPASLVRKIPLPLAAEKSGGFLFCTDGLWENFQAEELERICRKPLREAASELLDTALARGGRDNITFILTGTETPPQ